MEKGERYSYIPKTNNSKSPSNFLLHPCQSGFRPSHSTQDTLLKTVDDRRIALDRGEYVGAILTDLSKAFDSIDHTILLSKLSAYGLHDTELKSFKDFLTGRMQRVCVDSTFSDWTTINAQSIFTQMIPHFTTLTETPQLSNLRSMKILSQQPDGSKQMAYR